MEGEQSLLVLKRLKYFTFFILGQPKKRYRFLYRLFVTYLYSLFYSITALGIWEFTRNKLVPHLWPSSQLKVSEGLDLFLIICVELVCFSWLLKLRLFALATAVSGVCISRDLILLFIQGVLPQRAVVWQKSLRIFKSKLTWPGHKHTRTLAERERSCKGTQRDRG